MNSKLKDLGKRILFFDGAMGTMLQSRGLKLRQIPEAINITAPEVIESIHRAYLEAGADFVTTNTFGANRFKVAKSGYTVEQVTKAAVETAQKATAAFPGSMTALDIGPTGRVMAPVGDASFDEIYEAVTETVQAGAEGCDVVLLETFTDLNEIRAAVLAVRDHCSLPIFATMSFEQSGRTFFGTCIESMIMTLEGLGVSALGANCSLGPDQLEPIVRQFCERTRLPVMVQPNAGLPKMKNGMTTYDITADQFARTEARFADYGAAILGGCCGTNPEYIKKVIASVTNRTVRTRHVPHRTGVCSAQKPVYFDTPVIIGERLNPTGKKTLQAALRKNDMDFVMREAVHQQDQHADVLDVNVGLPDVDEPALLCRVVSELQGMVNLPLQIDSSNPSALEAAVRIYGGKAIINSVNGKKSSLETVLPIARKYGACIIGLTLDEAGIPASAVGRLAVARKIVDAALKIGIPREDIFIDCLTLTASAQQDLVAATLEAVALVKRELHVNTVLGVSNVSFGLPARPIINRTMLALALMQGLTAAIMNPGDMGMQETLAAFRVLMGYDRDARDYIARCGTGEIGRSVTAVEPKVAAIASRSDAGDLGSAIIRGLKDEARARTDTLLKGFKPLTIVEQHIVPALDTVGRDYETGKLFLPQLIQSAEAAKASFERLQTALAQSPAEGNRRGPKIALATVYGDIHDIGKNIVKVLLENYNFDVIDLGRDVPPETVVKTVQSNGVGIVGLSALMTTTVASMKDTIAALRQSCPQVKILVGGAVLTTDLAQFVGADFYAKDAMESVRIAEKLCDQY